MNSVHYSIMRMKNAFYSMILLNLLISRIYSFHLAYPMSLTIDQYFPILLTPPHLSFVNFNFD